MSFLFVVVDGKQLLIGDKLDQAMDLAPGSPQTVTALGKTRARMRRKIGDATTAEESLQSLRSNLTHAVILRTVIQAAAWSVRAHSVVLSLWKARTQKWHTRTFTYSFVPKSRSNWRKSALSPTQPRRGTQ